MPYADVLKAYRTLDPAGWVRVHGLIPLWAALLAVALGIVLLLFGGGRAFRLVAGPVGAAAGALWLPVAIAQLGFQGANERVVSLAGAAALAFLGILFPPAAVFFAFGLPAGLFAGGIAGSSDWMLGFLPAFLLAGTFAAVLHRWIGAVASSIAGAWLLVIGVLAVLAHVGKVAQTLAAQPLGVVAAAALFAVGGSIFQLAVRRPPQDSSLLKLERRRAKKEQQEKKALEDRWSRYSSDRER